MRIRTIVRLSMFGLAAYGGYTLWNRYRGIRGSSTGETPAHPDRRISALGLRANGAALTTLPVLAETNTGGGTVAHALFNGGFVGGFAGFIATRRQLSN